MIFLVIMLFMIGQALNMGTAYWIIFGVWIFFKILFTKFDKEPSYIEKRIADKIDNILDEIEEDKAEKD